MYRLACALFAATLVLPVPRLWSQAADFTLGTLDPTRNLSIPSGPAHSAAPLPEQYIWLHGARWTRKVRSKSSSPEAAYFRRNFSLDRAPQAATLYFAGDSNVKIFLNGRTVLDTAGEVGGALNSALRSPTRAVDVASVLRPGRNTLAIEVTRVGGDSAALVAKIVPASRGVDRPPIVVTDARWKASDAAPEGWEQPGFDDAAWPFAGSMGAINSDIEFFQGNADSGLYAWPGYTGVSSFLHRYDLRPARVEQIVRGSSSFENIGALTGDPSGDRTREFTVKLSAPDLVEQNAPGMVLDFGKEVAGWLEFASDSDVPATVTVQYGESLEEMEHQPYLGVDPIYIPPHGVAHGPKSAFRYAKVRFLRAALPLRLRYIRLNGIYYPVEYKGSFSSSDPLLNRIWEVGAYTAHLCMQDDIWDATKRDRRRWMGDLDVSGDVIDSVFLDHFLMQDTLTRLIGPSPVQSHVNRIPGYSAFWVMGIADYYHHVGSEQYVLSMRGRLVELLQYMEADLGPDHLFANRHKAWPFVDWSPYFDGDTPQARMATDFEYYAAFERGAALLESLGDGEQARHFSSVAASVKRAAQAAYWDPKTGSFGSRWQGNAMAIYSGIADRSQYGDIWSGVLSKVGTPFYNALVITPYYNYYVISAMAETGHRKQALDWIRSYWGGMIAEGATSFWEAYDPSWFKNNFHASLQADRGTGYFVSLAHGWSSGPTAWLMEQILGIQPTAAGFREVTIRPDLAGLAWAKGEEPTPHGLLGVDVSASGNGKGHGERISVDLPDGVHARVLVPVSGPGARVLLNGASAKGSPEENGRRLAIEIDHPGHYLLDEAPPVP